MIGSGWHSRKEAAIFLTNLGYPCTAKHLEHLAYREEGPPFTRTGWRTLYYHEKDLRVWAAPRIKRVPA